MLTSSSPTRTRRVLLISAVVIAVLTVAFTVAFFVYRAVKGEEAIAVSQNVADKEERDTAFRSVKADFQLLKEALQSYEAACAQFPTTEQGLAALLDAPNKPPACANFKQGGFLQGEPIPKDPWERSYLYASDGKTFTIITLGKDDKEGGEGLDEDIKTYQSLR